jgi:hypothetical protein
MSHITLITYQSHINLAGFYCFGLVKVVYNPLVIKKFSLTRNFLFSRFPQRFPRLYWLKGVLPFDSGIFPEQTGNTQPCTGPASL